MCIYIYIYWYLQQNFIFIIVVRFTDISCGNRRESLTLTSHWLSQSCTKCILIWDGIKLTNWMVIGVNYLITIKSWPKRVHGQFNNIIHLRDLDEVMNQCAKVWPLLTSLKNIFLMILTWQNLRSVWLVITPCSRRYLFISWLHLNSNFRTNFKGNISTEDIYLNIWSYIIELKLFVLMLKGTYTYCFRSTSAI